MGKLHTIRTKTQTRLVDFSASASTPTIPIIDAADKFTGIFDSEQKNIYLAYWKKDLENDIIIMRASDLKLFYLHLQKLIFFPFNKEESDMHDIQTHIDNKFDHLQSRLDDRFDRLDDKIDNVRKELDEKLEKKLERVSLGRQFYILATISAISAIAAVLMLILNFFYKSG